MRRCVRLGYVLHVCCVCCMCVCCVLGGRECVSAHLDSKAGYRVSYLMVRYRAEDMDWGAHCPRLGSPHHH